MNDPFQKVLIYITKMQINSRFYSPYEFWTISPIVSASFFSLKYKYKLCCSVKYFWLCCSSTIMLYVRLRLNKENTSINLNWPGTINCSLLNSLGGSLNRLSKKRIKK